MCSQFDDERSNIHTYPAHTHHVRQNSCSKTKTLEQLCVFFSFVFDSNHNQANLIIHYEFDRRDRTIVTIHRSISQSCCCLVGLFSDMPFGWPQNFCVVVFSVFLFVVIVVQIGIACDRNTIHLDREKESPNQRRRSFNFKATDTDPKKIYWKEEKITQKKCQFNRSVVFEQWSTV